MVYIYILIDPDIEGLEGIRYCGKTHRTLAERLSDGYSGYAKNWIGALNRRGLKPLQVEIDYVDDKDWRVAEKLYITHLRSLGCPLTNLTDGGDGTDGYEYSDETKAKMSAAMMGNKNGEGNKGNKGKGHKHTEETKKKMSATRTGKKRSLEFNERMSTILKGREITEEWRAKISATLTGRKLSPERCAKMSATNKGKPWTAARRETENRRKEK